MPVQIPLFPLSMVLFPHMPAALHIFEERYREMMRDCQAEGTSFGIVAVREGEHALGVPHRVGTLAQIHQLDELDDGGYNLVVAGASRFRIAKLVLGKAYLVGEVTYLEDTDGDRDQIPLLARQVGESFRAYTEALRNLDDREDAPDEVEVPEDPELLSYLVAASLNIELPRRQQLLEEGSTSGRLHGCLVALRRERLFLDQMLARRDHRLVSVSLN